MKYIISGYVIIPPVNEWDDRTKVVPSASYHTFGVTVSEAWSRHMGCDRSDPDWSIKVQRWHNNGYRLKDAEMTIDDGVA